MVVWTLSILSMLAVGAGYQAWLEMRLTSLQLDHIKEDRLILAAVETAKQGLPADLKAPVAAGGPWARAVDGAKLDEGTFSYTVEDEAGRIGLNAASLAELQTLMNDDSPDAAQAILDWRQAASTDSARGASVDSFYASLPNPYPCKHAPFESLAELNLVQGMTPDRYGKLRARLTVFGDKININTASAAALAALGLGSSLVDKIVRFREDGGTFDATASISQKLGDLTPEENSRLDAAAASLGVGSRDFRLHLAVWPGDRPVAGRAPDRFEVVLEYLRKGEWTIKDISHV